MELFDIKINRCGGQNLYQRQLFFFKLKSNDPLSLLQLKKRTNTTEK
jgi:hypothetical protein